MKMLSLFTLPPCRSKPVKALIVLNDAFTGFGNDMGVESDFCCSEFVRTVRLVLLLVPSIVFIIIFLRERERERESISLEYMYIF